MIKPEPFLSASNGNEGIRFRRSDLGKEECAASECSLLCGDFWKAGYGKVQVVPSIQVSKTESHAGIITHLPNNRVFDIQTR